MPRRVLVLCLAGCAGAARPPIAGPDPVPRAFGPVVAAPLRPGASRLPPGPRDAAGRPDGDWVFDCDGIERGCRAWFEHGRQVQWALITGFDRYVIDAIDGGWRWQWWGGDQLRQEAGLAFEPASWTPGSAVTFGGLATSPLVGACAGPFRSLSEVGALESEGRCDDARWTEQRFFDGSGQERTRMWRTKDRAETLQWDDFGHRVERTTTAGAEVIDEAWVYDGTQVRRTVTRADVVIEARTWDPAGRRIEEDITTGADRRVRRWSPAGRLIASATWHTGKRTGWLRTWYDDGRRRTAVEFDADGKPKGTMVVWSPSGKRVAAADLVHGSWIGAAVPRGTRVISATPVETTTTISTRAGLSCDGADRGCLITLASFLFDPGGCLRASPGDPLAVWRGHVTLELGIDPTGNTGIVAIPLAAGLTPDQRTCLLASAPPTIAEHIMVELDLDLLSGSIDPPPPPPIPDIDFSDSTL